MKAFNEFFNKYLVDIDKSINKGIIGINYLESIKFLLIEKLENIDQNIFGDFQKEIVNQKLMEIKKEFDHRKIFCQISYSKESISKIKFEIQKDVLLIVLNGFSNFTIYDRNDKNISANLKIFKFMGLVLSEKTNISEKNSKDFVVLKITNI